MSTAHILANLKMGIIPKSLGTSFIIYSLNLEILHEPYFTNVYKCSPGSVPFQGAKGGKGGKAAAPKASQKFQPRQK